MSLKKFFVQSSHFLAGSFLTLLLGFISFPILTRLLSREEYGIMGLANTTIFLSVALAKAGLSDGIIRFYKEYSEDQEKLNTFSSTLIIRGLFFSSIAVALYLGFIPFLNRYLDIDKKYLLCFIILALYLLIRPMNIIVLNLLRVNDKTIFYNAINLIGKILSIGLSLYLLMYIIGNFYGYFAGIVLAEVAVSIVLFSWFFSKFKVKRSMASSTLAIKLAKFGLPLLISELSYLLLSYADRYMIVAFNGQDMLGLYTVGYNLASYLSDHIMFSLSYAIIPIYVGIYKKEGKEKTEAFLKDCLHYVLIIFIPLCFGYYAISKDLFVSLASEKYVSAAAFSPIILLGSIFLGLNNILNAGLYLNRKSKYILFIMLSAVVINIVANLFLLPRYGAIGAAVATLVACVSATLLTVLFSFKYLVIRVNLKAIVYYTTLSVLMYLVLTRFELKTVWGDMIVKITLGIAIFIPGVFLMERELIAKIKAFKNLRKVST